jgi:seryl-tRNA synthetase
MTTPLDAIPVEEFLRALVHHGLLVPTSVSGVFGRGRAFEELVQGFDRLVSATCADDGAEFVRFPPVIPRRDFERSGYLESFPHLAGSIFSFDGDTQGHQKMLERIEAGGDWTEFQAMTDVVLAPAACYPVYPTAGGVLPAAGRLFDVASYCFRREPSADPARMQVFRMREQVRLGDPAMVRSFRDRWIERARELLGSLGLHAEPAPANDPFFGRGGRLLALNQRQQELKYELVLPICSVEHPTALMSFNCHQDHFGETFGIRTAAGDVAHTACVGFGLERIALAILKTHGCVPAAWPAQVRAMVRS